MFEIFSDGNVVGSASVSKEGLYYHFVCNCTISQSGIFKITVSDGTATRSLGICVPEGKQFYVKTRVPTKYFHGESFLFNLEPAAKQIASAAIAVGSHEPFNRLDKLTAAHLEYTDGQPKVIIDSEKDRQDSGLSPECQNRSELQ